MKTIRTIFLFTAIMACIQLANAAIGKQQHTVTFNVNMETAQGFDPGQHMVYLTGSFTGWAEPGTAGSIEMNLVEKTDGSIIYTVTAQIPAGHNEYKYFSDAFGAGWAGGEWPGDPNRVIMVTGNTVINNTWGVIEEENVFTVSFEVSNEAGDAIDDALITFNNIAYSPGTYVFENISPGTYNYSVARDGYITHHDQLDVIDDDLLMHVELVAEEVPTFAVSFTVSDDEGADIPDAIITLHNETNSAGNYVFEGITPGTYDFLVEKAGFEDYNGSVIVSNEDVTVDVIMNAIETMIMPHNLPEIAVFPNPVATKLHIRSNDDLILDIMLIDMVGRIIHQADIMDNEHSLNVSDLKNGIYFIRINTQNSMVTERIIVNN